MLSRVLSYAVVAVCTLWGGLAHDSPAPPRRAHRAMVYDGSRHAVLLAGGSTPLDQGQRFQFYGDLWALTDSGWRLVADPGDPRSGFTLAYDAQRREVWSFGGYNGEAFGDLRVLRDGHWISAGQHPKVVAAEPGFVYDVARGRFVMFGGSGRPGGLSGGTWESDGTTWTAVTGPNPPARQAHAMVYDAARSVTLLFGGMAEVDGGKPPQQLGDTWQYDGRAWTHLEVTGPSPRASAGVAFDSRRGQVVLFGGLGGTGFLADTWTWDGKVWRQVAVTGPEPRAMGYLAYDARRDRVVLFGGRKGWPNGDLNDTWEWDGDRWTALAGPRAP